MESNVKYVILFPSYKRERMKVLNGFKILEVFHNEDGQRRCRAICKVCGDEFERAYTTFDACKL